MEKSEACPVCKKENCSGAVSNWCEISQCVIPDPVLREVPLELGRPVTLSMKTEPFMVGNTPEEGTQVSSKKRHKKGRR